MTIKATTRDLGFAIRDFIEGYDFHHYEEVVDESGELQESEETFEIANVDVSDPNNLNIRLDNGQTFVVRIFAGE
jgi:hypothetical protein